MTVESWILSYLLNALWQVPLLLCAGWLAARLLRPLGSLVEHRIWVTVLFLQCLIPALSTLSWDLLLSLPFWRVGVHAGPESVTVLMGAATVTGGASTLPWFLASVTSAYVLWCLGCGARFVWRLYALRRLLAESSPVQLSREQSDCWATACSKFGVQSAAIASSARIFSPLTFGIARKVLLMPHGMQDSLAPSELASVMAHECAHMQREDFAWNLVYQLAALPVCFHPFTFFTVGCLAASREMVCDELAAGTQNRTQYARTLLRLASLLVEVPPIATPHAIGIFEANTFERRVMNLTKQSTAVPGLRRSIALVACAVFGVATATTLVAMRTNVNAVASASQAPGAAEVKAVHVDSKSAAENLISKTVPKYPVEAKKKRIQGKVVLDATINKEGDVENLKVKSGPKELQQSALDAVREWKYKPYLLNGNSVEVDTTINIIYTLSK